MTVVDDVGLLCMIIDGSQEKMIKGRTKLQKIAYFCKYLGWDIRDYKLHYYGPFSFALTSTVGTAESLGVITQTRDVPHTFALTPDGKDVLAKFEENMCDSTRVKKTRLLVSNISKWNREKLELAATIDFVYKNEQDIKEKHLIKKVSRIKENYSRKDIINAHKKWKSLKKFLPLTSSIPN